MPLPQLVLLHGWGVNSQIWNPVSLALREKFEVVLIDLPGYGNDHSFSGEYSLEAVVHRIMATAPAKAHWVAWSLGATIAMRAALREPERFLTLQLISATPRFMIADDWQFGMEPAPLQAIESQICEDYQRGLKKFLLLQTENRNLVRALHESLLAVPAPTAQTLSASLDLLKKTDLRSSIGALRTKTQVVAGASDRIVSPDASRWLANQISNAEWLPMDCEISAHGPHAAEGSAALDPSHPRWQSSSPMRKRCGHLPFLEQPEFWLESVFQFTGVASR
jgi:pimeloyl-[acyl-carrier protein] methyl ester esterase